MVREVGEMKVAIFPLIKCYFTLLFVFSVSYLVAEQQFNYRYRYSFWPPLAWQESKESRATFSSWNWQELHFELVLNSARHHRSLKEAAAYTLSQKKAEIALLEIAAEQSIWDSWAEGLEEPCLTMSLVEAETLLCSWVSKDPTVQDNGWLLILYNDRYYYIMNAWSHEKLNMQSAALLLSFLDSFALEGQQSWQAGIIAKLQQRFFYEKFKKNSQESSQEKIVFRKDQAQWSSPRWQALEAMNKALMARELIVGREDHTLETIERFYFFLFRSNISSFSRILKLIPAPLALWQPKKSVLEKAKEDNNLDFATESFPQEEFVQETMSEQKRAELENAEDDIDFSYLFEAQDKAGSDDEEEEDFSDLFSLGEENNLTTVEAEEEREQVGQEAEQEQEMEQVEQENSLEDEFGSETDEQESENLDNSLQRWVKLQQRRSPLASATVSLPEKPLIETERLYQLLYNLQNKRINKKKDFDPLSLRPPLMEFWAEEVDLQTLYLCAVLLLSQLGYRSALLYSWEYETMLLAIETAGEGARFSWFSRSYLLFDLAEKVYAGWAPSSTFDLQKWQLLSFPALSPQSP